MLQQLIALSLTQVLAAPGAAPRLVDFILLDGRRLARVETRVNEFRASSQHQATLAVGPMGKVAVAWESRRQLHGKPGSFWRVVDSQGAALDNESGASVDVEFGQRNPSIAWGPDGYPKLAFESDFRDESARGVYLGEARANGQTKGDQYDALVVNAPDGTTWVVWAGEVGRAKPRVFARHFDSAGRPLSPEIRVSRSTGGAELFPTATVSPDGLIVAWQRLGHQGELHGIWGTVVGADGRTRDAKQLVASGALEPTLTGNGEQIALAWQQQSKTGEATAYCVRLNRDLSRLGERIQAQPQAGSQNATSPAFGPHGELALAWNLRYMGERDIYVQTFDRNNRPTSKAVRLNRVSKGDQLLSEANGRNRIAWTEGGIAVAWSGNGGLGDESGVHLTRLVPARNFSPAGVRSINAATRNLLARIDARRPVAKEVDVAVRHESTLAEPQSHVPPSYDPKRRMDPWGEQAFLQSDGGFVGILDTGWTPPDPSLAVGPGHVVAMTNGAIAFFTKAGVKTFQGLIEGSGGFWGSLGATGFVFDPECMYDPLSGRFFAMAAEGFEPGDKSHVLIAVSDDSDPNGTWFKYRIETTGLAGNLFDSPNIGVDQNVVYVTGDGFGITSNYPVYTFDKASMLVGSPPAVSRSTTLTTSTQSAGIPPVSFDNPPAYYMIEHRESSSNTSVSLIALTNPLTTPTFQRFTLTVPTYTSPPEDPPQQGTTTRPEAFDVRFWSCEYRNGSLWATHHQGSSRVVAKWYEIKMNGWPTSGQNPSLVQSGSIDPGGQVRTSFSSIGVDSAGNAAVVCARSSPSEPFSFYRAFRKPTDGAGLMPNQAIEKSATGPYGSTRWGDYSGCEPDPVAIGTFWGHHEWSEGNSWRTWIQPFGIAPPSEIRPTSFSVIAGSLISGGIADLATSDNLYVVVQEAPPFTILSPSVRIEQSATSPIASPSTFQFNFEANCTGTPSASIKQQIELFDWVGNQWVLVDERAPSTTDQVITVPTPSTPARFVQGGTLAIKARFSWFDNGVFTPGWRSRVDRSTWLIGQ